jgi:hypothetical protein
VNVFHVFGAALAIWALIVSFLGVTREDFPGSPAAERLAGGISVALVLLAIGAAVYVGATKHGDSGASGESAALVR